jgi:hypothetical protein
VLTQCCDLAQDYTGLVHIARVVTLEGKECGDARSGRTSRYAQLDNDHFADLVSVAMRKSPLVAICRSPLVAR